MFSTFEAEKLSEEELKQIFTDFVKVLVKTRIHLNDVRCNGYDDKGKCNVCNVGLNKIDG